MQLEILDLDPTLTEKFVKFCCDDFKCYPDYLTIYGWDVPLKDGAQGLCYEANPGDYLIYVQMKNRNLTEIYNTLAHEMIHVKQFMKNDLNKYINAEHKPIYEDRWWEKEARQRSLKIVKNFVGMLYEMA